jgi:membrane peptidoglycan carboxypeptidase
VSPLEMAVAYSTLARDGVYMPPQVIRAIRTADGKICRTFAATPSNNISADAVAELIDVMQDVVKRGTGTQASLPGIAVAGKTGTADGARDIWFCGFTPDTVTTVWGGSDRNQAIRGNNVTGGTVMARIWRQYMIAYYAEHKPAALAFAAPTTRLATAIPKYGDNALLTIDVATENVSVDGAKVISPPEQTAVSPEQISANIPVIVYNSTNAAKKGIGKAFVVQGAGAVKRWQYSEHEHERLSRVAQGEGGQPTSHLVPTTLEQSDQSSQQAVQPATQHNDHECTAALDHPAATSLETPPPVIEQYLGNQKVISTSGQEL